MNLAPPTCPPQHGQVAFPVPAHPQGCGHIFLGGLKGPVSPALSFSPTSFFHFGILHPVIHAFRFFRAVCVNLFTSGLFLKDKPPMDMSSQVPFENAVLSVSALFVILQSFRLLFTSWKASVLGLIMPNASNSPSMICCTSQWEQGLF